jgi:hypothetical protein
MASLLSQHQDAVQRLAEVPGLGVDSAQQIIAEAGAMAVHCGPDFLGSSAISFTSSVVSPPCNALRTDGLAKAIKPARASNSIPACASDCRKARWICLFVFVIFVCWLIECLSVLALG